MAEIPALVASLGPFAALWEPLSEVAGYMVVMDGPVKVDLFPTGAGRQTMGTECRHHRSHRRPLLGLGSVAGREDAAQ